MNKTALTIPTCRAKKISLTVSKYGENFSKYGHDVPIMIFDDSSEEYSAISESRLKGITKDLPEQSIIYVGPRQKKEFLENLEGKLGSENEQVIKRIFRPSYGGNRNFILAYTMGMNFISVDDDMKPEGLFEKNGDVEGDFISKGVFKHGKNMENVLSVDQDIISGYLKFLGTKVGDHIGKVRMGLGVDDPDVDNLGYTLSPLEGRVMTIAPGEISPDSTIKIVQTHLSGDADIDSADFVNLFMETGVREILSGNLPKKFILEYCSEAITAQNDRLTGAILGYDNSEGGIYFLPTSFRCEDFIWRKYLESKQDMAAAYTKEAQTHFRSLFERASIAQDWLNELLSQRIKRRIRDSEKEIGENTMSFHDPYDVSLDTAKDIENQIKVKRDQALSKIPENAGEENAYFSFVGELNDILNREIISPELFARKLTYTVQEEFHWFNKTAEIWPQILQYSFENRFKLPLLDLSKGRA
jgi:hypothetical protein